MLLSTSPPYQVIEDLLRVYYFGSYTLVFLVLMTWRTILQETKPEIKPAPASLRQTNPADENAPASLQEAKRMSGLHAASMHGQNR